MTKRGFGTNFHKVYGSSPETYHTFSSAERFSLRLGKRIQELSSSGVLLDIACGTGHKTNLLSKSFEKVFALDYSAPLLTLARQKYGRNKKLNFLGSTATHIPLLDESVDTALVTWGSFPLSQTLREIKRVLKVGGSALRIGACVEDEFTALFPSFDIKRINRINKTFISQGFVIEHHEVIIHFKNLKEAKEILNKIVGVSKESITKTVFKHKVALCYYKRT
ncbi:MAG TPA: class I SAM-dependent methyltransferase [Candidatus Kaiserbacteria bacterium]|nr:class I SAM-dependent methyltransferase [Candidatus Kaiserbacteria bacterium]